MGPVLDVPDRLYQAMDDFSLECLRQSALAFPPVDTFQLARALGLEIVFNDAQPHRACCVRLVGRQRPQGLIVLRPDPRPERLHWAVAHELGEHLLPAFCRQEQLSPWEITPSQREWLANQLAKRLLLPMPHFARDVRRHQAHLHTLKERYGTASFEVIARRLLDLPEPLILTIADQGTISSRQKNFPGRMPPLSPLERHLWQLTHQTGQDHFQENSSHSVHAWAIHEPQWRREILCCRPHWPADQ